MKAKKLSKRIIAVVLTIMLVVGCFVIPSAFVGAAAETTTVNIHYLRDDKAYGDWDVWAWADGLEGNGYAFTDSGDANGAVATITISEATPQLGFIIRKPDWSAKDPEPDRYVDLSSVVSGTVEVYCKTGEKEFKTDYSGAKSGLKIKTAEAISHTEIEFSLTMAPTDDDTITNDDFSIVSAGGQAVLINAVRLNVDKGVIELADTESLDYSKEYTITFRDSSMKLTLPDYFSSEEFESKFTYDGDDLGVTFKDGNTNFRVWAPTANKVELNIYAAGNGGEAENVVNMTAAEKGTWVAVGNGNMSGKYYTYTAYFDGKTNADIVDPYARSVGVNGQRGMILDLDTTDPAGWDNDQRHTYSKATDMSIYEVHVRDFSSDPEAKFANPGKFVAFTETGVKTQKGATAGLDYLKDLGVTSVHILPSYDYGSVDETKLDQPQYNSGYDPVNYNAPEGSYSTDPYKGEVRVNEYKQMVKALHDAGIGVIMDVVYNHTYNTKYCFNQLVPGYFYRPGQNTSGCGNDVASERSMVRKFIVDSVKYWADEYHLDGFRFDLMGILDVDTMNGVRAAVDTLDKNIFIYGEGWDMGSVPTKDNVLMANYHNASKTPGIAYFSDYMRDTIRGHVFHDDWQGYVGGAVDAYKVKNAVKATAEWKLNPTQIINYDSCHDNHTIWDRLQNTNPDDSEADRIKMNKMAAAIVFTSQGVPFMMSGEEFLRTKQKADGTLDHNSYASPDSVNMLRYDRAAEYADVYNYYKGLIALRKAFPQFKQKTVQQVTGKVKFMDTVTDPAVGYTMSGDNDLLVFFNPSRTETELKLPEGEWSVLVNGEKAGTDVIEKAVDTVVVPALTSLVLAKDYAGTPVDPTPQPEQPISTVFKDVLVGVSARYEGKLENSLLKVAEVDPKDVKVTNKDVVKAYTFELTVNGKSFALNDKPLIVTIANTTKDLKIVAVDKDGKVTDIASTYKDGAYEFSITDLTAKYALVKDASANSQNSKTNQTPTNNTAAGTPAVTTTGAAATTDTVKTGDSSSSTAVVLIVIASSAALFAIVAYKRKKRV